MKRIFDITFAVLFFFVFLPIYLLTAIIIKCTSPGPILYRAKRIGENGKVFTCYKFRSMHVNSGKVHITTLKNDERIYPFGKFIRTAKIDEFPQVINIFLGEMSVVGPRPEDEDNAKEIYVGRYSKLLEAKPGLTSPGSIYDFTHGEFFENEEDYINNFLREKLELELYYVENANLWYDIRIVLRTAKMIIYRLIRKKILPLPPEHLYILERVAN